MNLRFSFSAAVAALVIAAGSPVVAAESAPAEYVANVRQHVAFLEMASRLAADHSSDDKVRAFAKSQNDQQSAVAKDLQAWEAGQPTGGLTSPMIVASAEPDGTLPTSSDKLVTGRSAAIDKNDDPGVLMPAPGVVVIPQLAKLKGETFDDLYETTQEASLKELAGLYEAYSMTGNDPTLRAMALRELPKVKQRLAELDAL